VLTGIVMTVVVAALFDGILILLGRLAMPWAKLATAPVRREVAA
jgi:hypothetical protein